MNKYIQKQTPELVLRNSTKFAGKHLCQSHFLNKVAGLRFTTLLKKRLWHRCFPMNFAKFLRTPFLQNISAELLLYVRMPSEKNIIRLDIFGFYNSSCNFK